MPRARPAFAPRGHSCTPHSPPPPPPPRAPPVQLPHERRTPPGSGEPGAAAPPLVLLLSLPLALLAVSTLAHAYRTAAAEPRLALPLLRNSVWLQLRLAAAAATLLAMSAEHGAPSAWPAHGADRLPPPCPRPAPPCPTLPHPTLPCPALPCPAATAAAACPAAVAPCRPA